MLVLEEWWRNKASIVILTTSTVPILETLNPSLFGFTFMQSITWTFALIKSSIHYFVLGFALVDNKSRN